MPEPRIASIQVLSRTRWIGSAVKSGGWTDLLTVAVKSNFGGLGRNAGLRYSWEIADPDWKCRSVKTHTWGRNEGRVPTLPVQVTFPTFV